MYRDGQGIKCSNYTTLWLALLFTPPVSLLLNRKIHDSRDYMLLATVPHFPD